MAVVWAGGYSSILTLNPLVWEPPYASGAALKSKTKKPQKTKKKTFVDFSDYKNTKTTRDILKNIPWDALFMKLLYF